MIADSSFSLAPRLAPVDMPPARSPSLRASEDAQMRSFELKFVLDESTAGRVERWVDGALTPDPHGDPVLSGAYRVNTLYLDTPQLDVLHRTKGYRRSKYRIRRYGSESILHLERKVKRQDLVRKDRIAVPAGDHALLAAATAPAGWSGAEFHDRIRRRGLLPSAHVNYVRRAWFGAADCSLRVTLDRALAGGPSPDWCPPGPSNSPPLLADRAVLELKFTDALPQVFRTLLREFRLDPVSLSKYRLCRPLPDVAAATGATARA